MSLVSLTLNVLECQFRYVCHRPLGATKREISKAIREFYKYGAYATPLLIKLAVSACFHYNRTLSLLFLPFFVQQKIIYLTEYNSYDLTTYLTDQDLFDPETLGKVWKVNCYRWGYVNGKLNLDCAETFLGLLPGLKVLTLKSHTTDVILEYLARYCTNLLVLDCREDFCCEVTNKGLKKLARIKTLRYVLFNNQAYQPKKQRIQMKFDAIGIARLMCSLPNLIKLECPEYLMRDALHSLRCLRSVLPTVESMNLAGFEAGANALLSANAVCPNIATLFSYVSRRERTCTAQALAAFTHLSSLTLNIKAAGVRSLQFDKFGHRLTVLDIKKEVFLEEDILTLHRTCPNLKLLAITDQKRNHAFAHENEIDQSRPLLFPTLETLVYKLKDIRGLVLFMHKDSRMASVFAKVGFPLRMRIILSVLECLYGGFGYWPFLEILSIPDIQCDHSLVVQIIEGLPSLQRINVRITDSIEGENFIMERGRHVKLSSFFEDDPFPPGHLAYQFDLS